MSETASKAPAGLFIAGVVCAAAFALLYVPVVRWLVGIWSADDNYSHGFIVPLIAAFFVYSRREELARLAATPSRLGWVVVAAGVLLYTFGVMTGVKYFAAYSILAVLFGVTLVLGGSKPLKFFAFPILYLLLMVPLPYKVYASFAAPLQLLASRAAVWVLRTAGAHVYADANIIRFAGGKSLAVAEACSGLRSILGLTATGLAFVYILREETWVVKLILVLVTVPIAILTNIIRVSGTGLLYHLVSPRAAEGFFHTLSGWLIFLLALFLFLLTYHIVRWLRNFLLEEEEKEQGAKEAVS